MAYIRSENFSHATRDKIGVLITNLGTPSAPTARALRPYLKQFLSDPRVVEVPRLLWWFILNIGILNIRPRRSAKAYESIWTDTGSPLMNHTENQCEALEQILAARYGDDIVVDYAMRYGSPSIHEKIQQFAENGVRKLLVLPLYPQYSASTSGSTFDAIALDFTQRRWLPDFRFISHYNDRRAYIAALAQKIQMHWQAHGRADKLLFSYHGIPKRYLDNGDPYHCECYKTSRLVAEYLGLPKDAYMTVFQSRFGREEWLKPYCDETLKALPSEGVKTVQILCPGFSSDCLETLEEIAVENRDYFLEAGGERYEYIAALNSDPAHIDMLADLVCENLNGWTIPQDPHREQRARIQGAEI